MPLGLLTMTPTTIRTAKQMRDGFKQGGYKKETRVMNALIRLAEAPEVKPCPEPMMELVDETLAEMERIERERYEKL
jgi:hypothetical protein